MKKTLIVLMMVLLSAMLIVSCDDNANSSSNGNNSGGSDVLPSITNVGEEVKIGNVTLQALYVDKDNDRALLISKDILEKKAFDSTENSYAVSTIRKYLNTAIDEENFFKTYGLSTSYMKKVIFTSTADGSIEKTEISDLGSDYVFLLSASEAEEYFNSDKDRVANYGSSTSCWWVRTPYGTSGNSLYHVDEGGDVVIGDNNYAQELGVRPAFWYAWAETDYKITYTIGDGATAADGNPDSYTRYKNTAKNEAVAISKAPTKSGYTFKGWKLNGADDNTATKSYEISSDTTGDIELVAVWEKNQYLTQGDAISNENDIIYIGTKEGNLIAWLALAVDTDSNTALLISKDIVENKAFDSTVNKNYSSAEIRTYLNNSFLTSYGLNSVSMKKVNVTSNIGNTNKDDSGSDRVFLLTYTEVFETYKDILNNNKASNLWWTRSPYSSSNTSKNVYCVNSQGSQEAKSPDDATVGIRPAFWYSWE